MFDYTLNVTGACQTGFGAVLIEPSGGVGPYTFDWYNPELGLGAFKDNLPAGTYFVRANDSQLPVNNEFFINIIVSDCLCVSVLNVNSTTCGLDNGSVTGTSSSVFATTNYYLYTGDDTYITSAVTNTGTVEFTSLSAGTYYLYGFDLGGATGYSQNFIVQQSSPLNYGLYVAPDEIVTSKIPWGLPQVEPVMERDVVNFSSAIRVTSVEYTQPVVSSTKMV